MFFKRLLLIVFPELLPCAEITTSGSGIEPQSKQGIFWGNFTSVSSSRFFSAIAFVQVLSTLCLGCWDLYLPSLCTGLSSGHVLCFFSFCELAYIFYWYLMLCKPKTQWFKIAIIIYISHGVCGPEIWGSA